MARPRTRRTHGTTTHTNYVEDLGDPAASCWSSASRARCSASDVVTLITAFGIAIVKAYLVAKNFMHLNIEKKWVVYILGFMLALMLVFFGGVAPDVLEHDGLQWQKTYVEPATTGGEH